MLIKEWYSQCYGWTTCEGMCRRRRIKAVYEKHSLYFFDNAFMRFLWRVEARNMNMSLILAVIHSTRADREVRHRRKGIGLQEHGVACFRL